MATVTAKNIAPSISSKQVSDFFSFCGKINSIDLKPSKEEGSDTQIAVIKFEKKAAAETAILLQDAQLGPNKITIESDDVSASDTKSASPQEGALDQENKPKSAIFAEVLSHGYFLSDKTIEAGIDFDQKHGLFSKFSQVLSSAANNVQQLDMKLHVSENVAPFWNMTSSKLSQFYDAAVGTPAGARIHDFYSSTTSRVAEVHAEARRLANMREGKDSQTTPSASTQTPGTQE